MPAAASRLLGLRDARRRARGGYAAGNFRGAVLDEGHSRATPPRAVHAIARLGVCCRPRSFRRPIAGGRGTLGGWDKAGPFEAHPPHSAVPPSSRSRTDGDVFSGEHRNEKPYRVTPVGLELQKELARIVRVPTLTPVVNGYDYSAAHPHRPCVGNTVGSRGGEGCPHPTRLTSILMDHIRQVTDAVNRSFMATLETKVTQIVSNGIHGK